MPPRATLGEGGHPVHCREHLRRRRSARLSRPPRIRQLFAKAGQHDAGFSWDLAQPHAQNRLIGNGPIPESMLAQRRAQVQHREHDDAAEPEWQPRPEPEPQALGHALHAPGSGRHAERRSLNDDYDPPDVTEAGVENRTHTKQRGESGRARCTASRSVLRSTRRRGFSGRPRWRVISTRIRGVVPTEDPRAERADLGWSRASSLTSCSPSRPTCSSRFRAASTTRGVRRSTKGACRPSHDAGWQGRYRNRTRPPA